VPSEMARLRWRTVVGPRVELAFGQEARANRTILVVDDEVLVRMLIADKLRKSGLVMRWSKQPMPMKHSTRWPTALM
jgi:hypothetical protein